MNSAARYRRDMPADVRGPLKDVVARVTGCDREAVTGLATLDDLGIDSLALVEIVDELGRRTGGYLSDDALVGVATIGDLERATNASLHTPVPAWVGQAALVHGEWNPTSQRTRIRRTEGAGRAPTSRVAAKRLATTMAVVGAAIGMVLGLGGFASELVLGLPGFQMSPLATTRAILPSRSVAASAEPSTPSASPPATPEAAQPTLTASATQLRAGERLELTGAIPAAGAGAVLQIQRRDATSDWSDFPVTATTQDGGTFSISIVQEAAGTYLFRLRDSTSSATTPEISVEIISP